MQTCYCCDDLATSREHVPPKCIFPKADPKTNINYRENLLTVPSCEAHNQTKTRDDEYLRAVLTMCIGADAVASRYFSESVLRGAIDRPNLLRGIFSKSQTVYVKEKSDTHLSETVATEINRERVERSLEHVALGIFFHQFGVKHRGTVDIFPFFLGDLANPDGVYNSAMLRVKNICDQTFRHLPRIGLAPDIFYYQTYFDKTGAGLIHLVFYGGVRTCCLLN